MTQDEIIRMAREAGIQVTIDWAGRPTMVSIGVNGNVGLTGTEELERFAAIVAAHEREKQAEQEPVAIGSEWKPCMKLPVVVHVREQREGESHVSTREGITPVRPDDLIMRGVAGEEYPIGRELFNKTYTFDTAAPVRTKDLTDDEIESFVSEHRMADYIYRSQAIAMCRAVIAADREKNK